jgi:mannosyltransferase OCH1-like enzyme
MKREYNILLIVNGLIIFYIIWHFLSLINLALNENLNHSKILDSELLPVKYFNASTTADNGHTSTSSGPSAFTANTNSHNDRNDKSNTSTHDLVPDRPLLIPKIIHQTYKTKNVPLKWNETYSSVQKLHPDYEFMFWTDESSRQFIAEKYPWFLSTYDSYPYNIMRSDSIRYFILWHYGGVYIDLDCGVDFKIDPLLAFPAWLRQTDPIGVSNDIMGSIPGHPFFLQVIKALKQYNRNYHLSYLTIMYSTGPLFLSTVRHAYYQSMGAAGPRPDGEVRVLVPIDYELNTRYFFFEAPGSSWHQSDANIIQFMGHHLILTVLFFTALIFLFLLIQLKFYRWVLARGAKKGTVRFIIKKIIFPFLLIKNLIMALSMNHHHHQSEQHQRWDRVLCSRNSRGGESEAVNEARFNHHASCTADCDQEYNEKEYLV